LKKEPEPVTASKESSPLPLEKANRFNLDRITDQLPWEESPLHPKKGTRFHPYIFQAAERYQIEPSLIMAIIMAESGYNPKAVSKKGAKGLMQLMPETAEALGVQDIFNPAENINGGVKYLKRLIKRYDGNIELALAAYNAGSSNVRRYKGIPPFKTTHFYIKKVIKYHQYYKKRVSKEIV
jgi:soluble lytic murein transglycosylase-like protein